MGGGLEDERGAVGGDDGVGGGRRRGGNAFFILVSLYVLGQVVAAHEPLGALRAHELLLSCGEKGERVSVRDACTTPRRSDGVMGGFGRFRR